MQCGRQQCGIVGAGSVALLRRVSATEHAGTIIGARLGTQERSASRIKQVKGGVIGIGPQTDLGIIGEVRVRECITVIGPGRIATRGNRYTLVKVGVGIGNRELANEPTIGNAVIHDDDIAIVISLAITAKTAPERVDLDGAVAH